MDAALEREYRIELLHGCERERRDHRRGIVADLRSDVGKLEQFAPRMRPACGLRDWSRPSHRFVERVESAVGVGLKNPAISGEMPLGMHAAAIGRVEVDRCRRIGAAKRAVVPHIGPQPPGRCLHLGPHRHGGVVAMEAFGGEHVGLDHLGQRQQRRRAGADMIGHRRHREIDAFARKLFALPVERLMIGVFVDQDHRQQARPGEAPGDRMKWRRRLRDLLAGPAAELLPHMFGHEHLPRHDIQRLGDILADLRKFGAAAARATGRGGMNDAPARQVIGKVAARLRAPHELLRRFAGGAGFLLARRCGQFFKLEFELIDQALAALGARAEQLALHLGDQQLQMFDQSLGAGQLGARLDQCSLQRILVFGNVISRRCHIAIRS